MGVRGVHPTHTHFLGLFRLEAEQLPFIFMAYALAMGKIQKKEVILTHLRKFWLVASLYPWAIHLGRELHLRRILMATHR